MRMGAFFSCVESKKKNINVTFRGIEAYSEFHNNLVAQSQKILNGDLKSKVAYVLPGDKILVKVCQFSDTHFTSGSDFLPKVYDLGIKMMIREKPDLLIHCGDLTNDSFPESYAISELLISYPSKDH